MATPPEFIEILYVGFGAGQPCMLVSVRDNLTPPVRVRQTGEIWAVEGRAVARVAALNLHRARTVA